MNVHEQLQRIAEDYRASGEEWPATTRMLAKWAIETGAWKPHRDALIHKLAEDFQRALREEYFIDPQGRKVRAKHCARVERAGAQLALWDDLRTAEYWFITNSFQTRRRSIVGDCKQLKTDVDSYNDNRHPPKPIQIIFDFTHDLEEIAAVESLVGFSV